MSLLLLIQGGQVVSNDRTFTATWVQPVYVGGFSDGFDPGGFATGSAWHANITVGAAPPAVATRHFAGKRLRDMATVTGPAGQRQVRLRAAATLAQAPATWTAIATFSDDELAIAFLLLLHD